MWNVCLYSDNQHHLIHIELNKNTFPLFKNLIWFLRIYKIMCMIKKALPPPPSHCLCAHNLTFTPQALWAERGRGQEGSFLSRQQWEINRLRVGEQDKAIGWGSVLWLATGWARSSQCNVQYAVPQSGATARETGDAFWGFPPRVSQPAALRGILGGTVTGLWVQGYRTTKFYFLNFN